MEVHPNGYWINPEEGVNHHFDKGLAELILNIFKGEGLTFVDLGCGPGHYTNALHDAGHNAYGFDGDPATETLGECFCRLDLTDHDAFKETFKDPNSHPDVVLCLEVGEHIPREKNRLIEQIGSIEPEIVIISWAVPGQGGDGHVWERTNEDVIADFAHQGYYIQGEYTKSLREAATLWWFKNTLMVFCRAW